MDLCFLTTNYFIFMKLNDPNYSMILSHCGMDKLCFNSNNLSSKNKIKKNLFL